MGLSLIQNNPYRVLGIPILTGILNIFSPSSTIPFSIEDPPVITIPEAIVLPMRLLLISFCTLYGILKLCEIS